MHRDFLSGGFYLIGSTYFFKGLDGFEAHDLDFGKYQEVVPLFPGADTCHTIKDGNCYFIWKKDSPENLIKIYQKKSPMASGKFLIPELNKEVGFTIEHLKQLEPVFNFMDKKHSYEKVIFDSYIENNDFYLTNIQRNLAYNTYKRCNPPRPSLVKNYKLEQSKLIIYSTRLKKLPGNFNKYGRSNGILGTLVVTDPEREEALKLLDFFRKSYPETCAYETVNYIEPAHYSPNRCFFNYKEIQDKASFDFDFFGNFKWDENVEKIFKDEFIKNNFHCDLQLSPHGVHFISEKSNYNLVKSMSSHLKSIIKFENDFDDFFFDLCANVKILDGSSIGNFKVSTIKNWT